ncbi:glycoside hydrolase family 13 protein [Spongiimicrobium salis]|uniref:glycoside hydrolase family 13 protein n=1 Tax=Spongiimicrobium salis TaxID=1667022 RepID=UPI00374D3245
MRIFVVVFVYVVLTGIHSLSAQNPIQRVEPPNWWVGMTHNEIELLVYGNNIASYDFVLMPYEGVMLKEIKRTSNKNYYFISLNITPEAKPGNIVLKFSKQKASEIMYEYPLLEREAGRATLEGFNNSDAIYLITPDRFVNGDPNNDARKGFLEQPNRSFKGGRHGGDIAGLDKSLDYIQDLGFTAIWINPMLENNMPNYSYHGYAITDFYKVDERYGSNESFKKLCADAKKKGMKVIMDIIANHCGLEHWWMKDLPSEDWINQWPEYTGTNHKKTVVLDPYASQTDTKQFFDGWFVPTMPDLNQRNASMAKYLIQNSLWWIEYAGISGIRMDTYPYPDMYFMRDWTKAVMTEYPNFNIVGEEWVLRPTIVSYWQKGKENANGYTSDLKSLMDFPLQNALVKSLNGSGWNDVYEELGQDYLYPNPNDLVVFPDNHDMSRIFSQLGEDFDKYKLALAYFATIRGIPQFYYGTEVLMKNPGTEDHGIIRSDFPGGWEGDRSNAFTGKGLGAEQREAQQFVKKLLNWRKSNTAIHHGKLMHFAPGNQDEVYVFFRYTEEKKVMVILNKNRKPYTLDVTRFNEIIAERFSGEEVLSGKRLEIDGKITLKAMTPMIIEIDE